MAIGCGPKLSKCILILFNLVFWLSGLIMIVIAAMYMSNVTLKHIDKIIGDFSSRNLLIGILIVGIIIFVIAFCGCCGAIKESKMLLGIYILLLMLIIIIQIAIGILGIVYKSSTEERLTEEIKKNFRRQYSNDSDASNSIDYFQKTFSCCGVDDKNDWVNSHWYNSTGMKSQRYPPSCCDPPNNMCGDNDGKDVYKAGCLGKLKENIGKNSKIIIGVVLGIAFFEIFVVVCAFCLCRNTGTLRETV